MQTGRRFYEGTSFKKLGCCVNCDYLIGKRHLIGYKKIRESRVKNAQHLGEYKFIEYYHQRKFPSQFNHFTQ